MNLRYSLVFTVLLTIFATLIAASKLTPIDLELHITWPFSLQRDLELKRGLDLQGGVEVTLQADMSQVALEDRSDALESARDVIARRVDLYGVVEPQILTKQVGNNYRIAVALPGLDDSAAALSLIGQTAQLIFSEVSLDTPDSTKSATFINTDLTGQDLKKASVQFNSQTGKPEVGLEFKPEGGDKFSEITARNIGKPLAIILDDQVLSAPIVQQQITGGSASINGEFTLEEVKSLVISLNAGALPVPIEVIEQKSVSATLGQDSITKSLTAGIVGLAIVSIFMCLMYGQLGLVASLGLVIYATITLAVYKLIPITITLPGLAGFLLSIGMAVDSNILIFERVKEELRKGQNQKEATELGFGRAWDAIRDANLATLITTFFLFNPLDWDFLNSSGIVRGFALTLFLGVVISLFTGIFVTRTIMRLVYARK